MVLKTEREARLLATSKKFDEGLASHDVSQWTDILAPNVVLHKDGVTLQHDLTGQRVVRGYYQAYVERYTYEHTVIAGAVDPEGFGFSFHVDSNVRLKGDSKHQAQVQAGEAPTSYTYGVFYFVFNAEDKIAEIYFLRQLSADEAARKMKKQPDLSSISIDPARYKGSAVQDEARAHKHQAAADAYNKIWATGDHSAADRIFAPDARFLNIIYGGQQTGLDSFKSMIDGIFKEYKVHDQKTAVAVTPSDKAFVWWAVQGEYKGDWSNVFGITFMEFDKADKIAEVLTWMQPFPAQRRELIKEE